MSVVVCGDEPEACVEALIAHGALADDGEIVLADGEARHEVLAYIDAAARPAPGWIESVRAAFADPRVTLAGGPVHALWESGHVRPARAAHPYPGLLDHGDRDLSAPAVELAGADADALRELAGRLGLGV